MKLSKYLTILLLVSGGFNEAAGNDRHHSKNQKPSHSLNNSRWNTSNNQKVQQLIHESNKQDKIMQANNHKVQSLIRKSNEKEERRANQEKKNYHHQYVNSMQPEYYRNRNHSSQKSYHRSDPTSSRRQSQSRDDTAFPPIRESRPEQHSPHSEKSHHQPNVTTSSLNKSSSRSHHASNDRVASKKNISHGVMNRQHHREGETENGVINKNHHIKEEKQENNEKHDSQNEQKNLQNHAQKHEQKQEKKQEETHRGQHLKKLEVKHDGQHQQKHEQKSEKKHEQNGNQKNKDDNLMDSTFKNVLMSKQQNQAQQPKSKETKTPPAAKPSQDIEGDKQFDQWTKQRGLEQKPEKVEEEKPLGLSEAFVKKVQEEIAQNASRAQEDSAEYRAAEDRERALKSRYQLVQKSKTVSNNVKDMEDDIAFEEKKLKDDIQLMDSL